ncbi:MAG: MATE family efflux transporter [Spirochaeta sp.]
MKKSGTSQFSPQDIADRDPSSPGLYRRLIGLAMPIMSANLLQMLYNLVDSFFLGRLGPAAVSAPAISFNLIFFVAVFGMAFSSAGTTLIAQSKGKRDQEKVDFYLGQMMFLGIAMSVLAAVIGVSASRPILQLLHVPADAFEYTNQYLTIIFAGLPLVFISFLMQGAMQGIGNSVTPLIIKIISVCLNVILDPLLIFGIGIFPRLEVAGAAIATITAQGVASLAALYILLRGRRGMKLRWRNLRPQKRAVRLILRIALPSSIGQGVSALGFTVLQGVVNSLGTAVIAAFGIGGRIIGLFNMPAIGFSRATAALVGQSLGMRRKDQAVRVVRMSVLTVLVFISAGMTLTFFYGNYFIRFFVDDPEVIRVGATMFRIISVSVIPFALFTVIMGAFEGAGDTKPVMFLHVFRLWGVRVPLATVLISLAGIGALGIWWAMFASNILTAAIGFLILSRGSWLHKLDPEEV